jgi:hypothetical protein
MTWVRDQTVSVTAQPATPSFIAQQTTTHPLPANTYIFRDVNRRGTPVGRALP